jgi:lysine biosynthesis protein LysW
MKVVCPDCQNEIEIEEKEYKVGDIIECAMCGSELEVVEVKPDKTIVVQVVEEEK